MVGKRKAEEPLAAGSSSKKQMTADTRVYRKDPRRASALKKAYVAVAGAWKPVMVELLNRAEATFTSDPLSPEVAALLTELEGQYDRTTEEYLTHHERVAGMKRDELLCQREAALAAVHDEFQDRTRRAEEEMIAHGRVSIMKRFRKEHKIRLPPGADRHLTTLPNDPDIIKVQALVSPTPRCGPRFYQEAETIWDDWHTCTEAAKLGPQPAPFPLPRSYREIMAARAAEEKDKKIAVAADRAAEVARQDGERERMIRRAGNLKGYVKSRERRPEECRWQGAPPSWRKKRDAEKEAEKKGVETKRVRRRGRKGNGILR